MHVQTLIAQPSVEAFNVTALDRLTRPNEILLNPVLKPHVTKLVVCNPRRNALLKEGSKSDRIDARKLPFRERYNQRWIVQRLGYLTPAQARQQLAPGRAISISRRRITKDSFQL